MYCEPRKNIDGIEFPIKVRASENSELIKINTIVA